MGLIPAHAGKTRVIIGVFTIPRAHPRSRGENPGATTNSYTVKGSSPLTRGKHAGGHAAAVGPGLIPAHAGKTVGSLQPGATTKAHPRSRGENIA